MGKNKRSAIITLILLFLSIVNVIHAQIIDRIVALSGEDLILLSNLKKALMVKNIEDLKKIPREKQEAALDELIERSLLSQKAKKLGITVLEKEIDEEIENVKAINNITTEILEEALKKEGVSLQDYRNIIRHQIVKAKIISREIRPNLYVTDEILKRYYEKDIVDESQKLVDFEVLTIYRERVEDLEDSVKDFYNLAKKGRTLKEIEEQAKSKFKTLYSVVNGVKFSELAPELKKAMSDMQENQLGPLVGFSEGFQIFILRKINYKGLKPFEEVKEELKKTYTKDRLNKLYADYLAELKKEFYVEKRL